VQALAKRLVSVKPSVQTTKALDSWNKGMAKYRTMMGR
jgi:hypothetical protein